MAVKDIGVRLVVENLGGFLSGMRQYNAAIDKAADRTAKFAERAGQAGRALTALAAPLILLGVLSTRAAISFETAFIGVRKTVDATEEQFASLELAIRKMAQEIPASAVELAGLGEAAGQLGIKVEAIEEFTRVMAALGVTTNLSSREAATSLARLVNITGLAQDQFDRLGATIVDLGNNMATTEGEILTFGLRIASAGQLVGLTDSQILSIGASMSALGIRAEAGGTAVQRVLLEMLESVVKTSAELSVFAETAGVSAQAFADLFRADPGEAFRLFVEGLGTAGDEGILILQELGLQDVRLSRSFLALAGAGDLLAKSMTLGSEAFAANTALVEEAEKRYASAASQISVARNRLNELFIVVGASLVPALLKMLDVLSPVITVLADLAASFPELTLAVIGLSIVVGALGIGLIGLSFILPGLVILFPALAGGITLAAIASFALAVALSPITLIALAIGAALIAGIVIWTRYADAVKKVVNVLRLVVQLLNPITAGLTLLETFTGINIPGIRGFAHGGFSGRSGPAVVGERGPELVNLPAGAQVTPVNRSNTFNVTANYANQQDPATILLDLQSLAMQTRS